MNMPALPTDWEPTRNALQAYAQAVTAHARAAAEHDPRWNHVAMNPVSTGGGVVFRSAPVGLSDDTSLVAELDPQSHLVTITAGTDTHTVGLEEGPSPHSLGTAMSDVAAAHGSVIDVERDRFSDDTSQVYDADHAAMWGHNAAWTVRVLTSANEALAGDIAGPHLWPHGFDIATEWFSERIVDDEGANAQIAAGFYLGNDPYFYVNPWPFEDAWAQSDLPGPADWNVGDWNGAKLPVAGLDGMEIESAVTELIHTVHEFTRPILDP